MKNVIQFLNEVKSELARVIWPKQDEFIGSTIVVLVLITIAAIYLHFVDLGFSRLVDYILNKSFSF